MLWLFAACAGAAPTVWRAETDLYVHFNNETNRVDLLLAVFVHVTDDDGLQDITQVLIAQDEWRLLWELDPTNWQVLNRNDEIWIGSSTLQMPDGGPPLPGELRCIVVDRAGERAEVAVTVRSDRDLAPFGFTGLETGVPAIDANGWVDWPVEYARRFSAFAPQGRWVGTDLFVDEPNLTIRVTTANGERIGSYRVGRGYVERRQLVPAGQNPGFYRYFLYRPRGLTPLPTSGGGGFGGPSMVSGPFRFP